MKLAQCWDDAVVDDIRLIEILRKHGAKASFNINAGLNKETRQFSFRFDDKKDVFRLAKSELTDVYQGFTIANHSLAHLNLADVPIKNALRDICDGRDALEQMFGCPVLGFAYPFGAYNDSVKEAVRTAGHVYARTVINVDHVFPVEDPMALHSNCHFMAPDFWGRFERVRAEDGVFYFWGHSYEMVTDEDWLEFDRKITRLSSEPTAKWVRLPELFRE
jgi:peptidoglycan/xylan/chitin deacetylase (PgdA/CDA1 family)